MNKNNNDDNGSIEVNKNSRLNSFSIYIATVLTVGTILYVSSPSFINEKDEKSYKNAKQFEPSKKMKPSLKKIAIFSLVFSLLPQLFASFLIIRK